MKRFLALCCLVGVVQVSCWCLAVTAVTAVTAVAADSDPVAAAPTAVSYHERIRPILQANCHGCHQPAKAEGDYVMTNRQRLLAGGESGESAIVPGNVDGSYLLAMITPEDGVAEMPQGQPPLAEDELQLIRRWIAEGAVDDTPAGSGTHFDADHPPIYVAPPVITALDFSTDGRYLAVAGFHEVLLLDADSLQRVGRLVGMSERIQSLQFSPDGKRLAVTGGNPARAGEVQVWDVARQQLLLSLPITYDTIYGASWSPDGKLLAFGCGDNSVRVIAADTGAQKLYQASHNDWVLDTAFSVDGSHLISVSRDRTAKLINVAEERFIDNITSITPGALKGGLAAVARHPQRDEVLVGGADGVPHIFRVYRQAARQIGDNANLVRKYPPLAGRIFGVAFSHNAQQFAVGSSHHREGRVAVYSALYDSSLSPELTKIFGKQVASRSPDEKAKVAEYQSRDTESIASVSLPANVYTVAFSADDRLVAAAGSDGRVRLIDPAEGRITHEFMPIELQPPTTSQAGETESPADFTSTAQSARLAAAPTENGINAGEIVDLSIDPAYIQLDRPHDYVQLVVTATLASGDQLDVTRLVQLENVPGFLEITEQGMVVPRGEGQHTLVFALRDQRCELSVTVNYSHAAGVVDYVREVAPVLSRLGCNSGTCHGSKDGKNGFKLSLRGYDPEFDLRALTDDLAARRVNLASASDSLMLLKAIGAVPHVGGQRTTADHQYYDILHAWISHGGRLNPASPRVSSIAVYPQNPILQRESVQQQVRVVATYGDGAQRDVTAEAFITSGNTEVALAEEGGLLTSLRRGEAPVLARYEGAYAATTLTVMGDREGFEWSDVPAHNEIDKLVYAKLQRVKTLPSGLCTDSEFLRRVYLDLTGLPPSVEDVRAFLADQRSTPAKRNEIIDRLIGSDEFIDCWTNKWADLLQVNRKFLGLDGAQAFRGWIREHVAANTPYDQFVREILTATGSNRENPAASYFKILRSPADTMENTTHLFLAVRFNCNKCHDHPFERWTQDQYYQTAAFFAQYDLQKDPASGDKTIGGTAVEGAKPLYEIVTDTARGEIIHERTGVTTSPEFPFPCDYESPHEDSRRQQFAAWLTAVDNDYFARSYVNRVWGYLFGVGIIEPIDDIRAGNPPTNPALLDWLTQHFIDGGFDMRELMRTICTSRVYQLSSRTNRWNVDDRINYAHAFARRLPAEVIYDAVHAVTDTPSKFPGVPPGTRAAALPDVGVKLPSGFLDQLGRPARESACECERVNSLGLGSVMALLSGPTVNDAIHDAENALAQLAADTADDRQLVDELFVRISNRPATPPEIQAALGAFTAIEQDHEVLRAELNALEQQLAADMKRLEEARLSAINQAEAALAAYQPTYEAVRAALKRQRDQQLAAAQKMLAQYDQQLVKKQLPALARRASRLTRWTVLRPEELSSTNGAELTVQPDGSVLVAGREGKTTYRLVCRADLSRITGLRLEAIPDERLPARGPGRGPNNGNFVLTELQVQAASAAGGAPRKLKLQHAQADYSQDQHSVEEAINGNATADGDGWAIHPDTGQHQTAVFEVATPAGFAEGTVLTFELVQNYQDGKHALGRFRLLVTDERQPFELDGIPAHVAQLLTVPEKELTGPHRETLVNYVRQRDAKSHELRAQIGRLQKQPPTTDPELPRLEAAVEQARRPIQLDPRLVRLRSDYTMSTTQLANRRLTAAQDLAWALINSPAFLFNH